MGKPQKKRGLADKVRKTKTSNEIKNNPFEVKINRKKFDILGRKTKHDVGLPGVSRSKAIKKRQETLLKEYKQKSKSNKFVDRRFGEYDTKMAPEDKILKRFALERQRMQDKKNIYNLNEEEELTHFGQSLSEIEKLNDVVDSDSESEDKGLLSAEFTASHFGGGGGLLRKKNAEEEGDGDGKPRSRQELIEELIIKSKQEKHERQTQKEEARVLTEKLDQDWKSIQSLMARNAPKSVCRVEESKPKAEEYDIMVRELGFEMKAQPSEKMKTPEEVAREERDRLQKLEADRQRRMLGDMEEETSKKQSYLSADDLNDGFILDKEDRQMLSYQDGKWNIAEEDQNADDDDADDADAGDDDDDGGNNDGSNDGEDGDDDDQHGESGSEEEGSDAESGHSDLDSEDVVEDDDAEVLRKAESQAKPHCTLSKEERLAGQEEAKAELPYTFPAPESFSDLRSLLHGHSADKQCVILERIQKCNHPSLAAGNKLKLQKMFGFLLEYVGDLATRCPPELGTVNKLVPHLYGLCQLFPNAAYLAMQNVLSDSAHDMEEVVEVKGRAALPGLGMLIYLKIVALLFPTSDFRHPVTTPALVYISQLLTKCPITSLEEVTGGLILCCLTLEYVTLSQRFVPELVSYLLGILHLAVRDKGSLGYRVVPPFRLTGRHCDLLVTSDAAHAESWSRIPLPMSGAQSLKLKDDLERDHYKLSCLATCLDLVKRCSSLYKSLPSFTQIFWPIRILLSKHISLEGHSSVLQDLHREALEAVSESPERPSPLVFEKTKPIPLRLFTPKIVEVLDFGKKRGSSKQEREKEKLKHKYRKELKGALREIRKDTKFLAREKLTEIMTRDAERKRKVKELFGSLSTQEGEWKALKKKKRK
uniref:NOP14 nucleolar protein homolog (yeast) n=1 Tax=Paramormyrops kingsleyae TaxID=1676925 RepID=A0A3B3SBH4_9TELE|nr:nucleolar protein 14 [Paramormyrops kingsleyae]XP_023649093.1 nucleolar protein 14 [Paramormyrops kingsleyae]XP_023649094.1 nucleolar protein 14 [Paramormyrops kingsleyae]